MKPRNSRISTAATTFGSGKGNAPPGQIVTRRRGLWLQLRVRWNRVMDWNGVNPSSLRSNHECPLHDHKNALAQLGMPHSQLNRSPMQLREA